MPRASAAAQERLEAPSGPALRCMQGEQIPLSPTITNSSKYASAMTKDFLNPSLMPNSKKKEFLKGMLENEFRDKVVRPLYILKGLQHGKDICGVDEDGKDCYFYNDDPIRGRILYAVQTKRGDIKKSSSARDNLMNAMTQLRTALSTDVKDGKLKQRFRPDCVVLVASGEINKAAEEYIYEEIKDSRIAFYDSDRLIPEIDRLMPELWYGVDGKKLPYLKRLRDHLISQSDSIDVSQLGIGAGLASPITDDTFVQLYLHLYTAKTVKQRGEKSRVLELEQFPIESVIRRRERLILITGEAGTGKTTSLRRMAMLLVQKALESSEESEIPVVLNASDVCRSEERLVDIAAMATSKLTPDLSTYLPRESLVDGKLALLIDGFDEVGSAEKRLSLLTRIKQFNEQFPLCLVILTSRDHSYVDKIKETLNFIRFRLSPINFNQTMKLIERVSKGKSLPAESTQELMRRLENVHGLELSPLLVTVFVATSEDSRQDIPANITELFKKFTEIMLGRWDRTKGLSQQYQSQLKDFLLCRLAFRMHFERRVAISVLECQQIIRHELAERGYDGVDVDLLYEEIVYRSGLLRVSEEDVKFRHMLLQEFFAGRSELSPDFLLSVAPDVWWTRAMVFHFGENPDNISALLSMMQGLQGTIAENLYQAAISVGLALQACYLAKKVDKIRVLRWVIDSLAEAKLPYVEYVESSGALSPNMSLITYYLYARDAVGSKLIREIAGNTEQGRDYSVEMATLEEVRQFWVIAGLIETGQLVLVEELVKKFHPEDLRLLLAVRIGCYYVSRLGIWPAETKKLALKICHKIDPKIAHISSALLKEIKGYLLEVQIGKIEAIEENAQVGEEGTTRGTG